jgi:hypothetical protein
MESRHFSSRNPPYRIEEYEGSEAKSGDTLCEKHVTIPNAEKGPDFIARNIASSYLSMKIVKRVSNWRSCNTVSVRGRQRRERQLCSVSRLVVVTFIQKNAMEMNLLEFF